ncbi:MAG: LytTR family DNA-binding domain-containing protein [Planctomycetes bacterium]|nr:LytTR family DNA-binding domain-containing protein [Planctomycetota bacterium]
MRDIAIALVDDDELFLDLTRAQLDACLDQMDRSHTIQSFTDPGHFLESFSARNFDIVFLDILFPEHNGVDLAKTVRVRNQKCQIVFLSVSRDFAVHGYDVNAAHYILKPIVPDKVRAVLDTCIERLERENTRYVAVKNGPELLQVRADDIVYIEAKGRYVNVYGDKGPMVVRFGKVAEVVPVVPPHFIRIHQSFLANLTRVRSIKNYQLHMDTGIVLPISRPYRSAVAEAFFKAVRREL